jgi:Fic family protein
MMDAELVSLLAKAERWLGRLNGAASKLPNADLFVAMYVRQEAVLSSQIEETQSTLEEVLQFEIEDSHRQQSYRNDVREMANHIEAMNYGLEHLEDLPLSKRLIRQIHARLLVGTPDGSSGLGVFRAGQNHIGPPGATLATATFVPPPVPEMHEALDNFERFLHDTSLPDLIHCGLAHAQFETIHPFWNGNGRVGRLLITFLLVQREVLDRPLLYLSHYLKAHRAEYYDRLMTVRNDGNWEGWLKFFLRGVIEVSQAATATTDAIFELQEQHRHLVAEDMGSSTYALPLLDFLFQYPIVSMRVITEHLGCTYATASKLLGRFEAFGLLQEITGWERNRLYRYKDYLDLFESHGEVPIEGPAA